MWCLVSACIWIIGLQITFFQCWTMLRKKLAAIGNTCRNWPEDHGYHKLHHTEEGQQARYHLCGGKQFLEVTVLRVEEDLSMIFFVSTTGYLKWKQLEVFSLMLQEGGWLILFTTAEWIRRGKNAQSSQIIQILALGTEFYDAGESPMRNWVIEHGVGW